MSPQKTRFVELLEELFQLNQPELDFGLYRIVHARSNEIRAFMQNELATEIDAAFADQASQSASQTLQAARQKVLDNLADDAFDTTGGLNPQHHATKLGKEFLLAQQHARDGAGPLANDGQIYDHLYRFFSRYYDKGDFLSKRYFVAENDQRALPYAVPYDGREVLLHWANKDQYYIKSSEAFSNYTFDLTEALRKEINRQKDAPGFDFGPETGAVPLKVHLRLAAAAEGEHNNVKDSQERFYLIHRPAPVLLETARNGAQELVIQFEYRPDPDKTGQAGTWQHKRLAEAEAAVLQALVALPQAQTFKRGLEVLAATDKRPDRTLLAKYLGQFADRNTMDCFIHKNLGGFLRRELDFYIKNEIMRLDDIESAEAPRVEAYLSKLRVLRRIAKRIIDFLAQLEDFQKKLWLKKKFVVDTQYLITLDLVDEDFFGSISTNEDQYKEWASLLTLDLQKDLASPDGASFPLTHEYLARNRWLVLDTANFSNIFRDDLISRLTAIDFCCAGVAINSENFQALSLVREKMRGRSRLVYIDPPYNTDSDEFVYKDRYQHSSWSAMQLDRLESAKELMADDSAIICNLNDIEDWRFRAIANEAMGEENYVTTVVTKCSTASSFRTANTGPVDISDRLIIYCKNKENYIYTADYVEKPVDLDHFSRFLVNPEDSHTEWRFASIKITVLQQLGFDCDNSRAGQKLAEEKWGVAASGLVEKACTEFALLNASRVFETKTLQKAAPKLAQAIAESKNKTGVVRFERNDIDDIYLLGGRQIYFLSRSVREIDGRKSVVEPVSTIWTDIDTNNLKHEGGVDFPNGKKPLRLIGRLIATAAKGSADFVVDYFAGSGSTAHAVMNWNRQTDSKVKFLLVEMGSHFSNTLIPRLKNATISSTWKNAAPSAQDRLSQFSKYIRLESFEDTLNNIELSERSQINSPTILDQQAKNMARDYTLHYWLNFETANSPSLLNVREFADPTAYKLKIKQPGSDAQVEKAVDLVETFNWLIGLHVALLDKPRIYAINLQREPDPDLPDDQHTRWQATRIEEAEDGEFWFRQVDGHVLTVPGDEASRERVLVVWRKLTGDAGRDQAALEAWLAKAKINPHDTEYATIYINGSHALPSDGSSGARLRMTEETFAQRMWEDT